MARGPLGSQHAVVERQSADTRSMRSRRRAGTADRDRRARTNECAAATTRDLRRPILRLPACLPDGEWMDA